MILFQLRCDRGDRFEAWFRGNAEFDTQSAAGGITCPICGSRAVEKALMAPAVTSRRARQEPAAPKPEPAAVKPQPAAEPDPIRLASGPDPGLAKAVEMMREITRHVRAHSDYVGPRFAEEARKIHYEEVPARSIYGEATPTEVEALAEEGVGFHPLPTLPEERN